MEEFIYKILWKNQLYEYLHKIWTEIVAFSTPGISMIFGL